MNLFVGLVGLAKPLLQYLYHLRQGASCFCTVMPEDLTGALLKGAPKVRELLFLDPLVVRGTVLELSEKRLELSQLRHTWKASEYA